MVPVEIIQIAVGHNGSIFSQKWNKIIRQLYHPLQGSGNILEEEPKDFKSQNKGEVLQNSARAWPNRRAALLSSEQL